MISLFRNIKQQEQFERDGYIVLPLFQLEQIEQIKGLYDEIPINLDNIFDSSSFYPNLEEKTRLNNALSPIFQSQLQSVLNKHKALGTSFLTKQAKADSIMPIHQDWTVVDEEKYCSVTCWVPLQDTSIENGAIQVIPGSHKFSSALRSPSLPISFNEIYEDLKPYLKTLKLKAGEALIFNHALMHASHPNLTETNRVAVTYGFTYEEAQLAMYYFNKGKVKQYLMPDNMFIDYPNIREEAKIGTLSREFEYVVPKLNLVDFIKELINRRKQRKMKPLFKDKAQQEAFEKNGFLKVPMLDQNEIEQLKNLHNNLGLVDEKGYGFHVGMDNPDKTIVLNMVQTIKAIALPKVEEILFETQMFTASFVIKEPNPTGVVPPHQDWSFVDNEEEFCSVTCWIPLQDVNIDNGCIGVIKGSNHFFENHRPSPSPQVDTPLKEHMFTIFPFLSLLEMKAGEALFFNNKTIHASPPNTTDEARLAIGLGFTQKEASISHYALKPGTTDTLLKYKIDADFFLKYDNAQLSKMFDEGKLIEGYEVVEELPYVIDKLNAEDFTKLMQESGNIYNAPLVGKMAKLFNYNKDGSSKETTIKGEKHIQATKKQLPFWKVYTPLNIAREIKLRLIGS